MTKPTPAQQRVLALMQEGFVLRYVTHKRTGEESAELSRGDQWERLPLGTFRSMDKAGLIRFRGCNVTASGMVMVNEYVASKGEEIG